VFGNRLSGDGVVFAVFASGPSGAAVPSPPPLYDAASGEYRTTYGGRAIRIMPALRLA